MGTSTGRRGPATRCWQAAKRTATRYFSAGSVSAVTVNEVVADYLLALEDTEVRQARNLLGAFRLTRKVAQELADLGAKVSLWGWPAALAEMGVEVAGEPPEILAATLSASLTGDNNGLEQEVVRSALAEVFLSVLPKQLTSTQALAADSQGEYLLLEPVSLVGKFLATVLCHRLVFDLGESLEAAAAGWRQYEQGLEEIRAAVHRAAQDAVRKFPAPSRLQGLAGWTWISQVMEDLLAQFLPLNHG